MTREFVRDIYGGARPVSDFEGEESRTKSEFQDEVNVNTIARNMIRTQQAALPTGKEAYGDFSSVGDFQSSVNRINDAQESFDSLPAPTRKHFGNDPAQLIAAFDDPSRSDELEEFGLVEVVREEPVVETPEGVTEPET